MKDIDVSVENAIDKNNHPAFLLHLSADRLEVNVWLAKEDLEDWRQFLRSKLDAILAAGISAQSTVFWVREGKSVYLLIGEETENWDISLMLTEKILRKIDDEMISEQGDTRDQLKKLILSDSEKALSDADLKKVEKDLGIKLPNEFVEFYKLHNGGEADRTTFEDYYKKIDDIEISNFFSLLYRQDFQDDPDYTLDGRIKNEWLENKIPKNLLPFTMDWGGNYICIGLDDGVIYYYFLDVWSKNLSVEQNFASNTQPIAPSFSYFINNLQLELEA